MWRRRFASVLVSFVFLLLIAISFHSTSSDLDWAETESEPVRTGTVEFTSYTSGSSEPLTRPHIHPDAGRTDLIGSLLEVCIAHRDDCPWLVEGHPVIPAIPAVPVSPDGGTGH